MTEISELAKNLEPEKRPLFDAVLVHGYWLSQKGDGLVKLSLRSHIEDRAAALFYDEGRGAGKIVLTAGHIWGDEYPSVAELMQKELVRRYKVPQKDIVVRTTLTENGEVQEVQTTDDEVEAFLQVSAENEWIRLADIAARVHNTNLLGPVGASIPILYEWRGQSVSTKAAEDVLKEDDPRVKALIDRLGKSRYEWNFRLYEGTKRAILTVKPDYSQIAKKVDVERIKKGDLGLHPKLPIDKYLK